MEGTLLHICISDHRRQPKRTVQNGFLKRNHGIEGDCHAGPWHRQISILCMKDIDNFRDQGAEIRPGDFGENLIIKGIDPSTLGLGSRLSIGEAEIELTQIGKVCHNRCTIYDQVGDCIMPRVGLFGKVTKSGQLQPGAPVRVVQHIARDTTQAVVATISDSRSMGSATDTAGPAVAEMLRKQLNARIYHSRILPDDYEIIRKLLKDMSGRGLDLIFTVGGTGCGIRDVTPEATGSVIEKNVPGLAEAMRANSMKITPHAMLQRGVCGIRNRTLIVNLPGSSKAATENLDVILPTLPHVVKLLRDIKVH